MRIGYPCLNFSVGCRANSTFRLKSYSESRLKQAVKNNLDCLSRILRFNLEHGLLFFRITSDLVPFASHPINTFDWQGFFQEEFREIGGFINEHCMRISMHPDQFTLINSVDDAIFERSQKELLYHAQVLDLLGLDVSAKIQIHVGGVYGDKQESMERFKKRYLKLDEYIRKRLVIENDDRLYDLADCLALSEQTKIPVLFDIFHHKLNHKTPTSNPIELAAKTWNPNRDGVLMVDYSSSQKGGLVGKHAQTIDLKDFELFLDQTKPFDFDLMLEIKDKEESALKAIKLAQKTGRIKPEHRPKP